MRVLGVIVLLLLLAAPVAAQGKDPLNPSGAIPWAIPAIQPLMSPTAYPMRPTASPGYITTTPTVTLTPSPSPTITPTVIWNTEHDTFATLAADMGESLDQVDYTDATVNDLTLDDLPDFLGRYSDYFFAYAKGLQFFPLKPLGGVLSFLVISFTFIVLVKVGTVVLPLTVAFVKFIIEIARTIVQFIPFVGR